MATSQSFSSPSLLMPSSTNPQNPSVQKDLAVSLDKAHRALSEISAGPFMTTHQALDQTSFNLQSTSKLLSDSAQNLTRSQANIKAIVNRINYAKDFFPSDKD